jgi:hypothetical protein
MARQALAVLSGDTAAHAGQRGRECVLRSYNWGENLGRIELLLEGDAAKTSTAAGRRGDISIQLVRHDQK